MTRAQDETVRAWTQRLLCLGAMALAFGCDRGHAQSGDGSGATATDDAHQHLERMAQEHAGDHPIPTEAAEEPPRQAVTSQTVTYATVGGQPVTGYTARPTSAQGALPSLVVIHEWWGLNDNIRHMADRLAGEGYETLAVDLYGGQVADTPDRARELMGAVIDHPDAASDNLRQAVAWLRQRNPGRPMGSIGWCFGGGWSLQTALLAPNDVSATVIYYGHLVTDPDQLATLQAAVLGHFGGEDHSISQDSIQTFESTLRGLGKSVEVHVYPGANHAFANPSGQTYQPEAAHQAWDRTVAFLAEHLQQ